MSSWTFVYMFLCGYIFISVGYVLRSGIRLYGMLVFYGCLTNYHEFRGLENQKCILEAGVQTEGVSRAPLLSQAPGRPLSSLLPSSGGTGCSLSWGLMTWNLGLHLHLASPPTPFFFSSVSKRKLVIGLRDQPGNPGWSRLKVLNLIAPAVTVFPNKVTLTCSSCWGVAMSFWVHHSLLFFLHFLSDW